MFQKVAESEFKPLPVSHPHLGALHSSDSQDSLWDSGQWEDTTGICHASRPILKATEVRRAGSQVREAKPGWTRSSRAGGSQRKESSLWPRAGMEDLLEEVSPKVVDLAGDSRDTK